MIIGSCLGILNSGVRIQNAKMEHVRESMISESSAEPLHSDV